MNTKKMKREDIDPQKGGDLSPEVTAAIEWAKSGLTLRETIDAAVERSAQDIMQAEEEHRQACEARAKAEADLALADSEAAYRRLEAIADKAAEIEDEKHRAAERTRRIREALCAKAVEADEQIAQAKSAIDAELTILGAAAIDEFAGELNEAIKPLLAMLHRYAAINNVLHSSQIYRLLAGFRIPDPHDYSTTNFLLNERWARVDGVTVDMTTAWKTDASAVAAYGSLQDVREISARLSKHSPFVHPDKRPKPYVRKGYTMAGRAEDAKPFGQRGAPTSPPNDETKSVGKKPPEPQELNVMRETEPRQLYGNEHESRGDLA